MKIRSITKNSDEYPSILKEISSPPQRLWLRGAAITEGPRLTVVGTRNPTVYGSRITKKLVSEVAKAGVTIVSGLALGIDGIAHLATLEAGGSAIAVLASGVDNITPATNRRLGEGLLASGKGTIISEYPEGTVVQRQYFVARNRIQSGLSEAVLIVEAAEKSGTLITAQFALDQNRIVMAVPGNADSPASFGTNELIKQGAIPVTCAQDILDAMELEIKAAKSSAYEPENDNEQAILELIAKGIHYSDQLLEDSKLAVIDFTTTLTMLEIKGAVRQVNPGQWDTV